LSKFQIPNYRFQTNSNDQNYKQLIRASGSQAANYIEANEALSKKDFLHRVRVCRKETKECGLWLRLCETGGDNNLEKEKFELVQESKELRNIYNSIIDKSM
jgi:four helix bundle protein